MQAAADHSTAAVAEVVTWSCWTPALLHSPPALQDSVSGQSCLLRLVTLAAGLGLTQIVRAVEGAASLRCRAAPGAGSLCMEGVPA